ncbi:hypothetical protein [Nocardioides sp. zg-1228]|uniref:hypothetical protein n=1 Tax=Nocardioides sp. zg-1228 TaxID=2763008 RepID=UPI001642913A|nr:hypothetical protein [Nocardioides sp. zg-1228]MBC2933348.1 hypothetical protein [Nocardioides sp. zg-1228]QSF56495.1 hypothetical protein JX575_12695 [Nocardioides sp. zg-1228]
MSTTTLATHDAPAPPRPDAPSRSWWLLLSGFLLVAVSEVVAPHQAMSAADDPQARAAFVVAHEGPLLVSYVMSFLAAPVIGALFVRLGCLPDGRGRVVGRIAAGLGLLGTAGLAGLRTAELIARDLYLVDPGTAPVMERIGESGAAGGVTFLALIPGLMLGLLLLACAGARAGWVGWWVVLPALAAVVCDFLPFAWKTVAFGVLASITCGVLIAGAARRARS